MISQLNSAAMRTAINSTLGEQKETKQAAATPNAKLTNENKIEQLKESINSGNYKLDLQAISEKMAQELL